jgi:hypothetical protein
VIRQVWPFRSECPALFPALFLRYSRVILRYFCVIFASSRRFTRACASGLLVFFPLEFDGLMVGVTRVRKLPGNAHVTESPDGSGTVVVEISSCWLWVRESTVGAFFAPLACWVAWTAFAATAAPVRQRGATTSGSVATRYPRMARAFSSAALPLLVRARWRSSDYA